MNKLETRPEEIFGLVDEALDELERANPKPKAKKRRQALPEIKIQRRSSPMELDVVDAANVVYVPDIVLKRLARSLNVESRELSHLLISKLMPLLLSYQAATGYTRAALKDGLDIEVDFDSGLMECVKHVGYLSVVMHFIKKSQLPPSVKRRFVNKFSDKLAEQAVALMVDENKAERKKALLQESLQAVVYSRQQNKTATKSQGDATKEPGGVRRPRKG